MSLRSRLLVFARGRVSRRLVRSLLFTSLAALSAGGRASAYDVGFEVHFVTESGSSCVRGSCTPIVPGPPVGGSFVLDSAALASGGAIDVSASFTSARLPAPTSAATIPAFSAHAIVSGGIVTGLSLSYSWSEPILVIGGTRTVSVNASAGAWSSYESASPSPPLPSTSTSLAGHFTVTPAGVSGSYPIPFEISHVATSGQSCSRSICFPIVPGPAGVATFVLDSGALATPGTVDVRATLQHPLLRAPLMPSTLPTFSALATIAGGIVTKVEISYSWSEPIFFLGGTRSFSFSAVDPGWSSYESASPSPPLPTTTTSMQGTYGVAAGPDADFDGVLDRLDDCPFAADPLQQDQGGIGAGSPPDGIGDACQCGDVNGDGRVTLTDAVLITRSQLTPPAAVLAHPDRCDVGGAAGCGLADGVIVRRALLTPPSATIQPACPAASGL